MHGAWVDSGLDNVPYPAPNTRGQVNLNRAQPHLFGHESVVCLDCAESLPAVGPEAYISKHPAVL